MNFDFLLIFLFFAALVFLASQITTKMISNMKRKKMFDKAKKGDRVFTYSGRKGKVSYIEGDRIEVELSNGKYALFRKEGIERIEQR